MFRFGYFSRQILIRGVTGECAAFAGGAVSYERSTRVECVLI